MLEPEKLDKYLEKALSFGSTTAKFNHKKKESKPVRVGKDIVVGIAILFIAGKLLTQELPQYKAQLESVNTAQTESAEIILPDASLNTEIESLAYLTWSGEPVIEINNNTPNFSPDELIVSDTENYSELDLLGRCGPAYVCLGPEQIPDSPRGDISSVYPSGWEQAEYDFIDGGYLYNRCHLVAFMLAGENDNSLNLITGTRYLNIEGMLPYESLIQNYIRATENHVLYRVTPVFQDNNLVCSGVLLEAKSIEDSGSGVSFCVYCFNVEPGVSINYQTGESMLV